MQKQKQKPLVRFSLSLATVVMATLFGGLALFSYGQVSAATGTNEQLNYQARLLTSQGAVVPDGLYNIRFRIYQDGDGVLGGGDETLEWTEARTGANRVAVKNGYFSVYLGSVTPFNGTVDWNQDTLWLSIDIGGTGGSPSYDGEMSPFTRFSSTPYAINSKQLDGLGSGQFVQLAQGQQTDSESAASIHINDTGGGNLMHLLSGGVDRFVVNNAGSIAAATALDTINGIVINNGAISGIAGFTQDSGNFDASASSGSFDTSSGAVNLNGNTTVTSGNTLTVTDGQTTLSGGLSVSNGINNNSDGITNTGAVSGVTTLSASGQISTSGNILTTGTGTITSAGMLTASSGLNVSNNGATIAGGLTVSSGGASINGGLNNTGDGITNTGAVSGVTTLSASGLISTSGNIATTSGGTVTSAGLLTASTGLTVSSDGANITGGIDNNNGGITEIGSLSGITSLSASGLITTTGDITTTSSGSISSATTVTAGTGLTVTSGGATIASGNLAITTGALTTNGTTRLTNAGALQNITGLTVTSGGASINGGLNNTGDGITNTGAVSGVATLSASGQISTSGNILTTGTGTITSAGLLTASSGLTVTSGGINVTGNSTIDGSLGGITGLTVVSGGANIAGGATIASGNLALSTGALTTAGTTRLTNSGALQNITGLTVTNGGASIAGGLTVTSGNLAITSGVLSTAGTTRLTNAGALQNITGLTITSGGATIAGGLTVSSGGASINGGLNNTGDGITNTGAISGATTITASGNINTTGGVYQSQGSTGINVGACTDSQYIGNGVRVVGGIIVSGSCRTDGLFSDARLKENIVALDDNMLSKLAGVETVNFDFKCNDPEYEDLSLDCDRQTGVIAQQLSAIFPELVELDEDSGYYQVNYDALNIYTLKAVTELAKTISIEDNQLVLNTASRTGLTILGNENVELFALDEDGNATFNGTLTAEGSVNQTQVLSAIDQQLANAFGTGIEVSGYSAFNSEVDFEDVVNFANDVILAQDVIFQGRPIFNNDTGGFATIEQGDQEVRVEFEHPFPDIPIVSVSNIDGQFTIYTYKDLDEDGFTIVLQNPATQDTKFSWSAFAIDNALTQLSSQDNLDN